MAELFKLIKSNNHTDIPKVINTMSLTQLNHKNKDGASLIDYAIMMKNPKVIKEIVKRKGLVISNDIQIFRCLLKNIERSKFTNVVEIMKILSDYNFDINSKLLTKDNKPLWYIACNPIQPFIFLLLLASNNYKFKDIKGITCFDCILNNLNEIIHAMITMDRSINVNDIIVNHKHLHITEKILLRCIKLSTTFESSHLFLLESIIRNKKPLKLPNHKLTLEESDLYLSLVSKYYPRHVMKHSSTTTFLNDLFKDTTGAKGQISSNISAHISKFVGPNVPTRKKYTRGHSANKYPLNSYNNRNTRSVERPKVSHKTTLRSKQNKLEKSITDLYK
jgi:hypothetical protein